MKLERFLGQLVGSLWSRKDAVERCVDRVMMIEGQISREEARQLIDLSRKIPAGQVIVEIGSYRGRSTVALAFDSMLGHGNRVYAIDPHLNFRGVCGGEFGPLDGAALYRNVVASGVGEIVAVVMLSSIAAARGWQGMNIGLLWIDGDHRYEAVRADYEAWCPLVSGDGIIAFHDTQLAGVGSLISELVDARAILRVGEVDRVSWFRKGH